MTYNVETSYTGGPWWRPLAEGFKTKEEAQKWVRNNIVKRNVKGYTRITQGS